MQLQQHIVQECIYSQPPNFVQSTTLLHCVGVLTHNTLLGKGFHKRLLHTGSTRTFMKST